MLLDATLREDQYAFFKSYLAQFFEREMFMKKKL